MTREEGLTNQDLSVAVWIGYPDGQRPMVNIRGYEEINGENLPLDVYECFMKAAYGEPIYDSGTAPGSNADAPLGTPVGNGVNPALGRP